MAYVLMPPLPHYAKRLKTRNGARESSADSGSYAASESSEDELVVSDDAPISDVVDGRPDIDGDMIAVEEDGNDEDAEAAAVAAESHSCLRETPCQWAGCGAALNSMAALQTHLANHASDKEEWGTFACHWHGCLGNKFVDKARLLKHLWKHASVPLLCPYEGCNEQFDEAGELLQHQQEQPDKHRSGRRPSNVPTASAVAENVRLLSALPGVVPAYITVRENDRIGASTHCAHARDSRMVSAGPNRRCSSSRPRADNSSSSLPVRGPGLCVPSPECSLAVSKTNSRNACSTRRPSRVTTRTRTAPLEAQGAARTCTLCARDGKFVRVYVAASSRRVAHGRRSPGISAQPVPTLASNISRAPRVPCASVMSARPAGSGGICMEDVSGRSVSRASEKTYGAGVTDSAYPSRTTSTGRGSCKV
ncbi:hypothetical protein C8Q80DRAFT_520950 [Daedaleopsis nitida]|nr:hypothetical protein C8Q80DRAFT_520950 [Daedaleopsis nitida]